MGSDVINLNADMSALKEGLSGKNVFIGACEVTKGDEGKELIKSFSEATSSNVIASDQPLNSGYKYNGGNGLTTDGNSFHTSYRGSAAFKITDVAIDKRFGVSFKIPGFNIPIGGLLKK
jgi:hypothetical protein